MRRWDVFLTLCDLLRAGLLGGERRRGFQGVPWDGLIKISSQHLVTPTLAWCLRGELDVPPDVAEFFDATLTLNARRNAMLADVLSHVVATLNAADLEPVLLKGAARLLDGTYPTASMRFLGDLDLMLEPGALADAADALRRAGFAPRPDDPLEATHHHLPMLYEPGSGAGIELHRDLAMPPDDAIVPAPWFLAGTRRVEGNGLRFRLPDTTRAIAHNVVHDQLVHKQFRAHGVELRQLVDAVLLMAHSDGPIDWVDLDRRFGAAGAGRVLPTYLHFAAKLFDQPVPTLAHPPRARTLRQFERRAQPVPTALRLVRDYLVAPRTPDAGYLRLLAPRTWAHRLDRIKAAFDVEV